MSDQNRTIYVKKDARLFSVGEVFRKSAIPRVTRDLLVGHTLRITSIDAVYRVVYNV